MAQTIIVVGHTEIDQWGNLLVTDKGGGVTKISKKRDNLFPLFQQGVAVSLDWQTYMDKTYVANASYFGFYYCVFYSFRVWLSALKELPQVL